MRVSCCLHATHSSSSLLCALFWDPHCLCRPIIFLYIFKRSVFFVNSRGWVNGLLGDCVSNCQTGDLCWAKLTQQQRMLCPTDVSQKYLISFEMQCGMVSANHRLNSGLFCDSARKGCSNDGASGIPWTQRVLLCPPKKLTL